MKEHYNILLATDYSEAVMNAERYAVQFAQKTNSNLTLLHVYKGPLISLLTENKEITVKLAEYKEKQLRSLKSHTSRLLKTLKLSKYDIECQEIVREGSAGKEILEEAKEMDVDFIIVGTHGESGFRETFFGTHTWQVIKEAAIPVLAIPQDAFYKGIKEIVFATEFREGEIPVIKFLSHLAKQFDAALTILHITNNTLPKDFEKQLMKNFLDEAKSQTNNYALNIEILKNDDINEGINNYCNNNPVDWLIMSSEKKFIFEKIFASGPNKVKKMAFQTLIPLLTVPDHYDPRFSKFLDIVDVNTYMDDAY